MLFISIFFVCPNILCNSQSHNNSITANYDVHSSKWDSSKSACKVTRGRRVSGFLSSVQQTCNSPFLSYVECPSSWRSADFKAQNLEAGTQQGWIGIFGYVKYTNTISALKAKL